MIVSINQPAYMPWLGYFERIASSDLHIVLDHVQFEKNSFTNRNKVRTKADWTWLTIPVLSKGKFGDLAIQSIAVEPNPKWRKKHLMTLVQCYGKAPYWTEIKDDVEAFYAQDWQGLADANAAMTAFLMTQLGLTTELRFSKSMAARSTKSDLVLDLCKEVGATVYLSGALGADYLDEAPFAEAGIEVRYQDYAHPTYDQCQPGEFQAYMSTLDLVANHGPGSYDILMSGSRYRVGESWR